MAHAFNLRREAETGRSLNSRPAWFRMSSRTARATEKETLLQKTKTKKKSINK